MKDSIRCKMEIRQIRTTKGILVVFGLMCLFLSCDKDSKEDVKSGTVTFGANSHIVNCLVDMTVFIDEEKVGTLEKSTDIIADCGETGNVTKTVSVGEHSYKVEISGCVGDISGSFVIEENECKKIFLDFYTLFGQGNSDQEVIISPVDYKNATSAPFQISAMIISGDVLNVKISASGCDGSSWKIKLIDSGMILQSLPTQRNMRIVLENNEACSAVITKEFSFDIEQFKNKEEEQIILNISGQSIHYYF